MHGSTSRITPVQASLLPAVSMTPLLRWPPETYTPSTRKPPNGWLLLVPAPARTSPRFPRPHSAAVPSSLTTLGAGLRLRHNARAEAPAVPPTPSTTHIDRK